MLMGCDWGTSQQRPQPVNLTCGTPCQIVTAAIEKQHFYHEFLHLAIYYLLISLTNQLGSLIFFPGRSPPMDRLLNISFSQFPLSRRLSSLMCPLMYYVNVSFCRRLTCLLF